MSSYCDPSQLNCVAFGDYGMNWFPKKNVVVPIDFSDNSLEAIRTALELVTEPTDVHVVHVVVPLDAMSPGVLWGTVDDSSRKMAVERHTDEYLEKHECIGVTRDVLVGDPGGQITKYAKESGCELIVIPSHGYHGFKRLLLGSVAERVIRHAECPVLVLRRDDAD